MTGKQDWRTPPEIYDALNEEYHFDFDPCPAHNGSLLPFDSLGTSWGESNFVNPPYKEVRKWVQKAIIELKKGKRSVFLINAITGTKVFHKELWHNAYEVSFIEGRVTFRGAKGPNMWPSMLVIFEPGKKGPPKMTLWKQP
jgi:site-specific DNA-methyltransferase (adenine-specific)